MGKPFYLKSWEDSAVLLRNRVIGTDGSAFQQADLSAISVVIYDITDGGKTEIISEAALTISAVINDTLQSWDEDSVGYNFSYVSPAAHRPTGDKVNQIEFKFTETGGAVLHVVWIDTVSNLCRS